MSVPDFGGFLGAAEAVLASANQPLHYREITSRAIAEGTLVTSGLTPEASLNAQLSVQIKRDGDQSTFIRTAPGVYGLRRWLAEGRIEIHEVAEERVHIPHYPDYDVVRGALPIWDGATRSEITGLHSVIFEKRGTPQSNADWSDPDTWIEERLTGEHREAARRLWQGSGKVVNPRHARGALAVGQQLHPAGGWTGRSSAPDGAWAGLPATSPRAAEQQIDHAEGLLELLKMIGEVGPASRSDLLGPFGEYLQRNSNVRTDATKKAFLGDRTRNLLRRGLIEKSGHSYRATQAGLDYLAGVDPGPGPTPDPLEDTQARLRALIRDQHGQVRDALRALLADIDPFAFEHLIKRLLEEMHYEDVEVTSPVNDKGVDVIARAEFGITSVKEVIQVKRQRNNVQRPVLDGLRGSLHRFQAVRGTIITTGDFGKGARDAAIEHGAAPITLVNGEKLIDLLIEHGIGVRKRAVDLLELDEDDLAGESDAEGADA